MTLQQQRADSRACWDLAIAELRRRMLADCRGAVPPSPAEIADAFARMVRR